jgi:hypothetical protein
MYSYGSGSCAEFFAGTLRSEARKVVGARRIAERLAARRPLSLPEYESIVLEREEGPVSDFTPERETLPGHFEAAYRGKGLLVLGASRLLPPVRVGIGMTCGARSCASCCSRLSWADVDRRRKPSEARRAS